MAQNNASGSLTSDDGKELFFLVLTLCQKSYFGLQSDFVVCAPSSKLVCMCWTHHESHCLSIIGLPYFSALVKFCASWAIWYLFYGVRDSQKRSIIFLALILACLNYDLLHIFLRLEHYLIVPTHRVADYRKAVRTHWKERLFFFFIQTARLQCVARSCLTQLLAMAWYCNI